MEPEKTNQQQETPAKQEQQQREAKKADFAEMAAALIKAEKTGQPVEMPKAKDDEQPETRDDEQPGDQDDDPKLKLLEEEAKKNESEEGDENDDGPEYTPSPWHDITADDFVRKDGTSISDESKIRVSEAFENLKKIARKYEKDYKKVSSKYEDLLKQLDSVKKEAEELKKWREERYFEESPEFKAAFIEPVTQSENRIKEYLEKADIEPDSPEEVEVRKNLAALAKAAADGDEVVFNKNLDKLVPLFGGHVTQTKFINIADEYFKNVQKRNRALSEKEAARKEILAKEAELLATSRPAVEEGIRSYISAYERENEQFVEFFRSENAKDFFQYDKTVEEGRRKAADLLTEVITNRRPSKELLQLVSRGILAEISEKEKRALVKQQENLQVQNENLKEELKKAKETLSRLANPSRSTAVKNVETKKDSGDWLKRLNEALSY